MPRLLRVCVPSVLALSGWMVFNWAKTGDLLKFFHAKWAWREVTLFGFGGRYLGTVLFHVALAMVALGVAVAAARRIPRSWKVLTGLSLLPSLVLGIVGLARYANECFRPSRPAVSSSSVVGTAPLRGCSPRSSSGKSCSRSGSSPSATCPDQTTRSWPGMTTL